jgi:hypothetical protein
VRRDLARLARWERERGARTTYGPHGMAGAADPRGTDRADTLHA